MFRRFYPVEALIVAIVLAIVPYLLLWGSINRLLRQRWKLLYLGTSYEDFYNCSQTFSL
ncbi:hypothetical protein [Chlorogloeopsis sp. ULAP02]|uniref:hypothetical protein n=1 Tax=Chlorogloeopsis sp. ULAP02 TaxID=3107926 RepID=UPI003134F10E